MSRKYKFRNQELPYFVTLTVVSWIDVFTRDVYREAFLESLKYCQRHKGLIVYAYCIMTNHIHMIIGTSGKPMQYILRDLKSYTSRTIKELISCPKTKESRRLWMIRIFKHAGQKTRIIINGSFGNNTITQ